MADWCIIYNWCWKSLTRSGNTSNQIRLMFSVLQACCRILADFEKDHRLINQQVLRVFLCLEDGGLPVHFPDDTTVPGARNWTSRILQMVCGEISLLGRKRIHNDGRILVLGSVVLNCTLPIKQGNSKVFPAILSTWDTLKISSRVVLSYCSDFRNVALR